MLKHTNPKGIALAAQTYTHVVEATGNKLVVVAGQVAMDETGRIIGIRDIEKQTHKVLQNIKLCLEAVGASMADVISRTSYVLDMDDAHKILAIFPEYFGDKPPPATLVGVTALFPRDALIEVEVTAMLD